MSITKKVDSFAHIQTEYLRQAPPCPKSVKIELTPRCNYRCRFCALSVREQQPNTDMKFELFTRITTEMREAGVQEVGLFYIGEPFISPALLTKAIIHVKSDLGFPYAFLTSQASLAKPQYVEACMAAGLDSLKWSINSSDPEQFKSVIRANPAAFWSSFNNIRDAWIIRERGGYKTKLYASSIKYDGEQGERMQQLLSEKVFPYVDEHYWLPLYSMGDLATANERAIGMKPTPGNRGRYDNPVDPLPCWSCFTVAHVLHDGRLTACCFDATGKWVVGDLNTQPFMDAWNSQQFQELRKKHLDRDVSGTPCETCAMMS